MSKMSEIVWHAIDSNGKFIVQAREDDDKIEVANQIYIPKLDAHDRILEARIKALEKRTKALEIHLAFIHLGFVAAFMMPVVASSGRLSVTAGLIASIYFLFSFIGGGGVGMILMRKCNTKRSTYPIRVTDLSEYDAEWRKRQ